MAIKTNDQTYFQFSIAGERDFIEERDFLGFTMIEEAGNVLPTFSLSFHLQDTRILALLHEGNELKVTFGKDGVGLYEAPLAITGAASNPTGQNKQSVTVNGLYGAIQYLSGNGINISPLQSGIEALINVGKKYFKVEGNVTASLDSQRWIQYNISDRAFVNKIWLHSDLDTSFPAVAISSDGKFIVKDIKKEMAQPYKWRFGRTIQDEKRDIVIDGDPFVKTQTGIMNAWLGYGREKMVYDIESAVDTPTLEKQENLIALSNKLAKSANIEKRFASVGIKNDNVHPNYWKAYMRNLTSLGSFLNLSVAVSFHNDFKDIRVLDQVMYKAEDPMTQSGSDAYMSGIYFVTKVSRTVQNSQTVTLVVLSREGFNSTRVTA